MNLTIKIKYLAISLVHLLLIFVISNYAICKELKIGLAITSKPITLSSTQNMVLIDLFNNQIINKVSKNTTLELFNNKGFITILNKKNNTKIGTYTGPIHLVPITKDALVSFNGKLYRGSIIIEKKHFSSELTIINNVDLEDYLLSVVPSEMPHTWHKEALKAQTVAARTYALGYLGRRKSKGYDLESTIEDQVYLGVSAEKELTSQAVKETLGLVLTDEKLNPIIALFHSSGGGYTDSIENIWDDKDIKPSIHIQPRPDYDDSSPYFKWKRTITLAEATRLLEELMIGELKEIIPIKRSISQRLSKIKLIGTKGTKIINGDDFRRILKLPSSKFNFIINNENIVFVGRGNGHGLGLSQWGAKALAEKGFTFDQILSHYYPQTKLTLLSN